MSPTPPSSTAARRDLPRPAGAGGAGVSSWTPFPGQHMPVTRQTGPELETALFTAVIGCEHTRRPEPCAPLAHIQIIDDHWIRGLDPDGLAAIAERLRAQADRLENEIRPFLTAARTDWRDHFSDPYTAHIRAWEARGRHILLALTATENEEST